MVVSNIGQLPPVRDALSRYSTFFDIMKRKPRKASKSIGWDSSIALGMFLHHKRLMYHLKKNKGWILNSVVLCQHKNPSVITIDLSFQSFSKSVLGNYQGWRRRFEKWSPDHPAMSLFSREKPHERLVDHNWKFKCGDTISDPPILVSHLS